MDNRMNYNDGGFIDLQNMLRNVFIPQQAQQVNSIPMQSAPPKPVLPPSQGAQPVASGVQFQDMPPPGLNLDMPVQQQAQPPIPIPMPQSGPSMGDRMQQQVQNAGRMGGFQLKPGSSMPLRYNRQW